MLSFLVATAFLAAANALAVPLEQPYPHGRVVGGREGSIDGYRYLATIQYATRPVCTGVIVSEFYLVTAAHCVDSSRPINSLTVRVDSNQRFKAGLVIRVDKVIVHEDYRVAEHGVPINDIALVKLKDAINATSRKVELYRPSEETPLGVVGQVTGWAAESPQSVAPTRFSVADTVTLGKDVCDAAYASLGGLPGGQICAAYHGEAGSDGCHGDSGAPLLIKNRVAGILSWGNGCAKPHFPAVYTEIAHYRDWIDEHAFLAPLNTLAR